MLTIFYLFWLTQTRICHYQTTTRKSKSFLRPRLLRDSRSQTLQILLALKIAKLFMIYFRRGWHLRILGRSLGEFYLQVPSNLKCTNKIWLDVENIYEIYRVSVKKNIQQFSNADFQAKSSDLKCISDIDEWCIRGIIF